MAQVPTGQEVLRAPLPLCPPQASLCHLYPPHLRSCSIRLLPIRGSAPDEGSLSGSRELVLTTSARGGGRGHIPGGGRQTASDCVGVSEQWPRRERGRKGPGRFGWGESRWNVTEGLEILG